jgi:hypothetical protein
MFNNKEDTIDRIICFGLYHYSTKNKKFSLEDVARQTVYFIIRHPELTILEQMISNISWEYISWGDCYQPFNSKGEFDPTNEQDELLRYFSIDQEFCQYCIDLYRLHVVISTFNLKVDNLEVILSNGRQIKAKLTKGHPMPMAKIDTLLEFKNKDKTEFELAQYVAYLAINSIIGQKRYFPTNKDMIRARMFGFAKYSLVPAVVKQTPLFKKYCHRYHMDKILKALVSNWKLHTYSKQMRSLYVCYSRKMTLEQLVHVALARKQKNKENAIKESIAKAEQSFYDKHLR